MDYHHPCSDISSFQPFSVPISSILYANHDNSLCHGQIVCNAFPLLGVSFSMKVSSSRGHGLRLHTTLENWGHWGHQLMSALCSIVHFSYTCTSMWCVCSCGCLCTHACMCIVCVHAPDKNVLYIDGNSSDIYTNHI